MRLTHAISVRATYTRRCYSDRASLLARSRDSLARESETCSDSDGADAEKMIHLCNIALFAGQQSLAPSTRAHRAVHTRVVSEPPIDEVDGHAGEIVRPLLLLTIDEPVCVAAFNRARDMLLERTNDGGSDALWRWHPRGLYNDDGAFNFDGILTQRASDASWVTVSRTLSHVSSAPCSMNALRFTQTVCRIVSEVQADYDAERALQQSFRVIGLCNSDLRGWIFIDTAVFVSGNCKQCISRSGVT